MKKIFFIHNHKNFSGAARSLGEIINKNSNNFEKFIICPKGSSSGYFKKKKVKLIEAKYIPRFNHFELGQYKGLRWFLLLREIYATIYFFFFLRIIKKKYDKIDYFHLNELELVICAPIIKFFYNSKVSSHIRSIVETKNGYIRKFFLKYLCKKFLFKLIAIDKDCYKRSPLKKKTIIVYNGIDYKNLKIRKNKKKFLTFGFIGNFIERKGIYDTLLVFKNLEKKKIPVQLICVGKKFKNKNFLDYFKFERNFSKFVYNNFINLCKNIKFYPMTFDLRKFYSNIDIILFPSYMNAVGRPVIEAGLLKKPSIIGLKGHNNDTAVKGCSLIFKPGDIKSFEKKILYFLENKSQIKKMGYKAFANSKKNFNLDVNSKKFFRIFKEKA